MGGSVEPLLFCCSQLVWVLFCLGADSQRTCVRNNKLRSTLSPDVMMVTIMIICTALRCQVASQQVNERKKCKVDVPQGTDCLDNLTTDRVPLPERSGQSSLSWSRHVAFCISDAAGAVRAGPGDAAQDSRSSSSRAAGSPGPPAPVLRRLPQALVLHSTLHQQSNCIVPVYATANSEAHSGLM